MQAYSKNHRTRHILLRFSLLRVLLVLLMMLCASVGLFASTIDQSIAFHDSIVSEDALSVATVLKLDGLSHPLEIGYRNTWPVWDVAVSIKGPLDEKQDFMDSSLLLQLHASLGTADALLSNAVLGYEQSFILKRKSYSLSCSYGLGVQLSMSFFPYLEKPLFNASPYLAARVSMRLHESLTVCVFTSTSTFFEFSSQSLAPILGADIAFNITDGIAIGVRGHLQLSDVYPESVLIMSKEAGFYATWTR